MDISPATVRRLIEDEELKAKRKTKSGPYLVDAKSVQEYLDEIEAGERHSPDYEEGWDRGYDQGFTDAQAESDDDDPMAPNEDDDKDER